jgi:hypothetical protein
MLNGMSDEELYKHVRKIVGVRGFFINLILFFTINILLIIIWRFTGKGFPWFAIPLGVWGIFILLHYLFISVLSDRRPISNREKKLLEIQVERLKEQEKLKKNGN